MMQGGVIDRAAKFFLTFAPLETAAGQLQCCVPLRPQPAELAFSAAKKISQAGAQLGFNSLWLMLFSYPLMAVTQEISARIGRTTGRGLAGNLRRHYAPWVATSCIALLLIANVIKEPLNKGRLGCTCVASRLIT